MRWQVTLYGAPPTAVVISRRYVVEAESSEDALTKATALDPYAEWIHQAGVRLADGEE